MGPPARRCRAAGPAGSPPRSPGEEFPGEQDGHGVTEGSAATTLDVWDEHLATKGAELLAARISLTGALRPLVVQAYTAVSGEIATASIAYRQAFSINIAGQRNGVDSADRPEPEPDAGKLTAWLREALALARAEEIERGVCLVGPHRDELELRIGDLPARGYASHGESWSAALALRLAAFELLREAGDDPVLLLDDVFAELDFGAAGAPRGRGGGRGAGYRHRGRGAGRPAGAHGRPLRGRGGERDACRRRLTGSAGPGWPPTRSRRLRRTPRPRAITRRTEAGRGRLAAGSPQRRRPRHRRRAYRGAGYPGLAYARPADLPRRADRRRRTGCRARARSARLAGLPVR